MDTVSLRADDGNSPTKQCVACGNSFPATANFFRYHSAKKGTLRNQCKMCLLTKQQARQSRPEMQERSRSYQQAYKKSYNSKPEKLERLRRQQRIYENRPEIQERRHNYQKSYNSKPETKEYHRGYQKSYYKLAEVQEKRRVHNHTHRARLKAISGIHTPEQIQEQLKRQKHQCYYCSVEFQEIKRRYVYHVDHTFPVSRVAGTNIPGNDISYLVLACPKCNMSKGNKFPWEWIEGGRLL